MPQTLLRRLEPPYSCTHWCLRLLWYGGYIFQLDQQQELSIRFISKALHKAQLNWSTFEREAYAIFYTITKFDFLLRDVQFVVKTDHKNLTFLKTAQSAKVRRWQLAALQEFDFKYIHIKGEDNVVADAFYSSVTTSDSGISDSRILGFRAIWNEWIQN